MEENVALALSARTQGDLGSALALLPADADIAIGAASGRIRRRGNWRVPRKLVVESAFGRVNLDLSRAIIEDPVIDIELRLGTGRARITVPRNAEVDLDGLRTAWKDVRYRAPRRARLGGPKIRISGSMGTGRLRIRHSRR